MKKFTQNTLFAAMMALFAQSATAATITEPVVQSEAGFHLIVKFKDPSLHQSLRTTPETQRAMAHMDQQSGEASAFAAAHHVSATPVDTEALMVPFEMVTGIELQHTRSASLGYDEIAVQTDDVSGAIESLMATGQFVSVEPVYMVYETAVDVNDPRMKDQFYFRPYAPRGKSGSNFDVLHAGFTNQLGRKVRFAVLDSGSWDHEDVNFAPGYNFVSAGMEPDRGRGENANAKYNRADGTSCQSSHGLSVASILGATRNNNAGIAGAFPSEQAEIVPVRVLGCAGGGTVDVMEGLLWASGGEVAGVPKISQRVDVANLSLGSIRTYGCSKYEQDIFNQVAKLGVTVIAAAGNNNIPAEHFAPGACGNVITVGSITSAGDKANFSNYGSAVDVVAEGDSIYNAVINDANLDDHASYSNGSGTSFSAPLVAALAGAMIAQEPTLTGLQVESRLKASALKNPSNSMSSNCRLYGCGAGLVQAGAAMGVSESVNANAYTVQHRYEGFSSAADTAWMTTLQSKSTACQTLKYTLGRSGVEASGVTYKIFVSYSGSDPVLLKEVTAPQFVHATPDNATVSFQRCVNGSCGNMVAMNKSGVAKPAVCM